MSNYWVANTLKFLELVLEVALLSIGVGVKPVTGIGEGILDRALVIFGDLVGEFIFIFNTVFHLINVVFKLILGIDLLFYGLVFLSILFRLFDHSFDFFFSQSTAIIFNCDRFFLSSSLVGS